MSSSHFQKVIDKEKYQQTSNVVGTYLISKLKEIQSEFLDWIGDVRGKG